jgi:hypothetical protein
MDALEVTGEGQLLLGASDRDVERECDLLGGELAGLGLQAALEPSQRRPLGRRAPGPGLLDSAGKGRIGVDAGLLEATQGVESLRLHPRRDPLPGHGLIDQLDRGCLGTLGLWPSLGGNEVGDQPRFWTSIEHVIEYMTDRRQFSIVRPSVGVDQSARHGTARRSARPSGIPGKPEPALAGWISPNRSRSPAIARTTPRARSPGHMCPLDGHTCPLDGAYLPARRGRWGCRHALECHRPDSRYRRCRWQTDKSAPVHARGCASDPAALRRVRTQT